VLEGEDISGGARGDKQWHGAKLLQLQLECINVRQLLHEAGGMTEHVVDVWRQHGETL
jgi:hypothetical protein